MGWTRGFVTRKHVHATATYGMRFFLETDGSTRRVKHPLVKYSFDGAVE